jgi:hypothetical protein
MKMASWNKRRNEKWPGGNNGNGVMAWRRRDEKRNSKAKKRCENESEKSAAQSLEGQRWRKCEKQASAKRKRGAAVVASVSKKAA